MLNRLFEKTPTVEEFREIVFRSLKFNNIQMPLDAKLKSEQINGFEYKQIWESQEQKQLFVASCKDVRNKKSKIQFKNIRLS